MLQVLLPPREEAIARAAETLPDGLLVAACNRADGLPLGLQRLKRDGRRHPVGRVGERRGALAERLLLRQIGGALLGLRREIGTGAREHLVLGGLESAPHGLALCARRQRHFLPARLQLAHAASGGFEVLLVLERLHLAAQLFLHLQVRPALPLVGFAQLLNPRRQLRPRRLEARLNLLPVLLRRQRRTLLEGGSDIAHGARCPPSA